MSLSEAVSEVACPVPCSCAYDTLTFPTLNSSVVPRIIIRRLVLIYSSWNGDSRNQRGRRRDLRDRQDVFQSIAAKNWLLRYDDRVARPHGRREHTSGPKAALSSTRDRTVGADNEDLSFVCKLGGASRAGEIPPGIPSRRIGEGIGVVHLPDDQHSPRLLWNRQRVTGAKLDIVERTCKVFMVRAKMYD